jgi:hypothetical protein
MVPSIRACSKSGSPDNHSKMRSNTPATAQRLKRWNTLFQVPKSLGRSRHGRPVRTRHNTASRKSLLLRAVTPRSDALPGKNAATFDHLLSSTTKRSRSTMIQTPPIQSLNHNSNRAGNPYCQQNLGKPALRDANRQCRGRHIERRREDVPRGRANGAAGHAHHAAPTKRGEWTRRTRATIGCAAAAGCGQDDACHTPEMSRP